MATEGEDEDEDADEDEDEDEHEEDEDEDEEEDEDEDDDEEESHGAVGQAGMCLYEVCWFLGRRYQEGSQVAPGVSWRVV